MHEFLVTLIFICGAIFIPMYMWQEWDWRRRLKKYSDNEAQNAEYALLTSGPGWMWHASKEEREKRGLKIK